MHLAPAMQMHLDDATGAVIIDLQGDFDRGSAEELRRTLDSLGSEARVVVDFSRVRCFRDLAIDVLARGLSASAIHVRGLGTHQERMFRYFGIRTPSRPSAAEDEAAYA
jgi:hypothetical protein